MTSKNDFPSFRRTDPAIGFVFSAEKSNSRQGYERAVAKALLLARGYFVSPGVRRGPGSGLKAFHKLLERAGRTIA